MVYHHHGFILHMNVQAGKCRLGSHMVSPSFSGSPSILSLFLSSKPPGCTSANSNVRGQNDGGVDLLFLSFFSGLPKDVLKLD